MESTNLYVIIPEDFDLDKNISISESAGITVDIDEVRKIIKDLIEDKFVHRWSYNYNNIESKDAFSFVIKMMDELEFIIFFNSVSILSGYDSIKEISSLIRERKDLILKCLGE